MKECFGLALAILIFTSASAQTVTTSPAVPAPSGPVTITFDVSGTDFAAKNLGDVWLWAWLENGSSDVNAPTNVNPATDAQNAAKVTRSTTDPDVYSITITATSFFNKPAAEITTVGVLLKGRDWSNGQTADKFINFTESFSVVFASPTSTVFFINEGESVDITVNTNDPATIVLKSSTGTLGSSSAEVTTFSYTHLATETGGSVTVTAEANNGVETKSISFTYVIRTPTISEKRPPGIIDGINYSDDLAKATLSLWAPGKTSVYVLGDFNDWQINPAYQMKMDGEHFWLELTGLTPGVEYAFQYLVDEFVRIADPYADKILDPDDQYISSNTYPALKEFPLAAMSDQWYFNRLAVLETDQQPYAWMVTDFVKPGKEELVIYELLIRDFFGPGQGTYQNLIDTIGYLKTLGVNAVELMPVMEFNGNESWGYNPTFMFAVDKYYGSKNMLKQFVDVCHQNGITVILDMAMNHHDMPNPYVMMDFDFSESKPQSDNRWFNVNATHPFNVFFDMNHESSYTQKYLDTVNYYWLNEYKVDGFRFDLSKGFTQVNNPSNVDAWSSYDASRVAILKRMADVIWAHTPDAYIILEHLSVNSEEKELAEYRSNEGKGMMLWGKMTDPYNQLTMGYPDNADISGVYHESRGWSVPHLVGYMESHDEERLMVKNILYGNTSGSYSAKDKATSLSRLRAASTLFYTIPGPKMLWQFGELGYDYSINYCPGGSIDAGCRLAPKPARWDYFQDVYRRRLYDHIRDLLRLRNEYTLFSSGTATIAAGNSLVKQVILRNDPYIASPSDPTQMNAVVIANFDLIKRDVQTEFPHTGAWYDYYASGASISVPGSSVGVTVPAGGYKIFTDVPLESPIITRVEQEPENGFALYPNPVENSFIIHAAPGEVTEVSVYGQTSARIPLRRLANERWDASQLLPGFYIAEIRTRASVRRMKIVKN